MNYVSHLSKDKKLKKLIKEQGILSLKKKKNIHQNLCASIIAQQLSVKVAEIIYQRFLKLFDSKNPSPAHVLKIKIEKLHGVGLSNSKACYIQNVSQFALEFGMDSKKLDKLNDEEIIQYLTQIKGVGRWTVEMQLIFTLAREDVFALDDLGLQTAMKKLYQLDDANKKEFKNNICKISEQWKPYRTYACLHLWKFKDS